MSNGAKKQPVVYLSEEVNGFSNGRIRTLIEASGTKYFRRR